MSWIWTVMPPGCCREFKLNMRKCYRHGSIRRWQFALTCLILRQFRCNFRAGVGWKRDGHFNRNECLRMFAYRVTFGRPSSLMHHSGPNSRPQHEANGNHRIQYGHPVAHRRSEWDFFGIRNVHSWKIQTLFNICHIAYGNIGKDFANARSFFKNKFLGESKLRHLNNRPLDAPKNLKRASVVFRSLFIWYGWKQIVRSYLLWKRVINQMYRWTVGFLEPGKWRKRIGSLMRKS